MTKHLRLIMLSLLAMICLGGYSQSEVIIWQEDWTGATANQTVKQINNNYSASNSDTKIFNEKLAGGAAPELLLRKSDTFVVTIGDLKGCSGELTLTYKSNNQNINSIKANDKPVTFTVNGKDRTAKITINEGTTSLKLEFSCNNKNNTRLDNFKLVGNAAGESQKKTSLSFPGEGVNLVKGKLDDGKDFYGYTAKEANDVPGTITYAASGAGVATVDATTGAVIVNPNVYGTTTITATFTPTETETYAGSTASYTITNKEPERTPTAITFGAEVDNNTFEVKDGDTFEARVAKCTTEGATGFIQYSSSDEAIAKVDATTGAITLGAKYGTAVITAKFVATGSFANSEASYSIKHVGDFVFYESFDKCDGTGGNDGQYSGNIASNKCENENLDESWERTGRVYAANKCLRVGKDGTATTRLINITGKAVLLFKTAAWKGDNSNINLSINGGTLNYDGTASESIVLTPTEAKWEDFEIEITSTKPFTLSFHSDKRFFLDDVMVIAKEITLDENGDNTVEKADNVNVTLNRTLYGDGGWNTLCVPFSLTAAQVKAAFGNDVELRKLSSIEGTTLKFVSTDIITAGEPCLIKVAKDGSTYNFEGVATIAVANNKDYTFSMVSGDIQFLGIYSPMDVVTENPAGPSTGYYAFLGEGNKFFKAQAETKMKGFRAFFLVPNNVPSNALKAVIDGTATGIEDLVIDDVKANGHVYNLNGQYVGNSLNGLQSGIYIQNGKKIVVK